MINNKLQTINSRQWYYGDEYSKSECEPSDLTYKYKQHNITLWSRYEHSKQI